MMELPKLFFSLVFVFAILAEPICSARPTVPGRKRPRGDFGNEYIHGQNISGVRASSHLKMWSQKVKEDLKTQPTKLFAFGDAFVDTGNMAFNALSWNTPYGLTNPLQPAGRYSNGRVLTDYVAKYFGLRTPPAYRFVNPKIPQMLRHGVNFAYGTTGVFANLFDTNPNMTVQISYFKEYVEDGYFNLNDLNNSLSVLSITGNDYSSHLLHGGPIDESFIRSVVNQIKEDMRSLCDLGAKTIAVTAMPPLGCLPYFAVSPTQCNETLNGAAVIHNLHLYIAVDELNTIGKCSNHILQLYDAFETAFQSGVFAAPYQGCCVGTNTTTRCGNLDDQGQPLYTVCSDPKSTFFWDKVHPTQAGWNFVYEQALEDVFGQINYSFEH